MSISPNKAKKKARKIRPEDDHDNIEYKLKLTDFSSKTRLEELTTQLNYRLYQGDGKAIYNLGFTDSGDPKGISFQSMLTSLDNLSQMAKTIEAKVMSVRIFLTEEPDRYCSNICLSKEINNHFLPPII